MSSHIKLLNTLGYKSGISFSVPKLESLFPLGALIFERDVLEHKAAHSLSFQLFWPKLHFIFPVSNKVETENVF